VQNLSLESCIGECCNHSFALYFNFVPSLLCRGDCFVHRICVLAFASSCVEDWVCILCGVS